MKKFKFDQSQIAVITALCIAVGKPIPADLPRWDGRHIEAFRAAKKAVTASQPISIANTTKDHSHAF